MRVVCFSLDPYWTKDAYHGRTTPVHLPPCATFTTVSAICLSLGLRDPTQRLDTVDRPLCFGPGTNIENHVFTPSLMQTLSCGCLEATRNGPDHIVITVRRSPGLWRMCCMCLD